MNETKTSAGFSVQHIMWGAAPVHIPDERGGAYKTELVLSRSPDRTEKINWWHAPDPRRDPHNHPWRSFKSTILRGRLTMTCYMQVDSSWESWVKTYVEGDTYELSSDVFHTVDSVGDQTVTHMICGPLAPGGEWGHISLDRGMTYTSALGKPDPQFIERLESINPHRKRKA